MMSLQSMLNDGQALKEEWIQPQASHSASTVSSAASSPPSTPLTPLTPPRRSPALEIANLVSPMDEEPRTHYFAHAHHHHHAPSKSSSSSSFASLSAMHHSKNATAALMVAPVMTPLALQKTKPPLALVPAMALPLARFGGNTTKTTNTSTSSRLHAPMPLAPPASATPSSLFAHHHAHPHPHPHHSHHPHYHRHMSSAPSPSSSSSSSSSSMIFSLASEVDMDECRRMIKAKRRRANRAQLQVLNQVFQRTFFPSTQLREQLGRQLGMSPRTVQIWFQNRRQALRTRERQHQVI